MKCEMTSEEDNPVPPTTENKTPKHNNNASNHLQELVSSSSVSSVEEPSEFTKSLKSGILENCTLREWSPLNNLLSKIPGRAQKGLTTLDLKLTCIAAAGEFLALGTNVGLVYWYNRNSDSLDRLKTENTNSCISVLNLVSSVDYMLAAGNRDGLVTIFQIPKSHSDCNPAINNNNRPEVQDQPQRFSVGGLHTGLITALEWSKNGMKLFSGDATGIVVMTDIDYDLGRIKSRNLLDEKHQIVQMSYARQQLLICSTYRSIVYSIVQKTTHKVGMQDRKIQGNFGGIFHKSIFSDVPKLFSVRPGGRIWVATCTGTVEHTIKFKDLLLENNHSYIPVINPTPVKKSSQDFQIRVLYRFLNSYLVSHNQGILYILDPINTRIVSVCQELTRVIDLAVSESEIFILESDRTVIRISSVPDKHFSAHKPSDFFNKMGMIPNIMSASIADFRLTEEPINYLTSKFKETSRAIPKINSSLLNTLKNVIEMDMDIQDGQLTVIPSVIPLKDSDLPRIVCENATSTNNEGATIPGPCVKDRFEHISQLPFEEVLLQPMKKKRKRKLKKADVMCQSSGDILSDAVSISSSYSTASEGDTINPTFDLSSTEFESQKAITAKVHESSKEKGIPKIMSHSWTSNSMSQQDVPMSDLETKEEILARKLNWPELLPDFEGYYSKKAEDFQANEFFNGLLMNYEKQEVPDKFDEDSCDGTSSILTLTEARSTDTDLYLNNPNSTTSWSLTSNVQADKSESSLESADCVSNVFEQSVDIYTKYARSEDSQSGSLTSGGLSFGPPSGNSSIGVVGGETRSIGDRLEPHIIEVDEDSIPDADSSVTVSNLILRDMIVDPVVVGNDSWVSYKAPAAIQSLSACDHYVVCTDSKHILYYSNLEELTLRWIQTDYQASQLAISPCGSVLWRLFKGILYSLMKPSSDSPTCIFNTDWSKLCTNVISIAVQKHVGWIVKSDGTVYACQGALESAVVTEFEKVDCPYNVTQLTMMENFVWAITSDGRVIYRSGITEYNFKGTDWVEKLWDISVPPVCAICTGPANSVWVADVHHNLYFVSEVVEHIDGGSFCSYPWKVSLRDFNFYNSNGNSLNGSLPSSFSFTSLKNRLSDSFKSERIASLISSKSTPIICGTASSIWYSTSGSASLCVSKSHAEGHGWTPVKINRSLRGSSWNNVLAGSIYMDHGYLWLLDSKGKLFYCKPEGGEMRPVDLPCSDDLVCVTPAPDALWILNNRSVIYARCNISPVNPIGHGWEMIDLSPLDNVHLVHISCGSDVAWGCDSRGNIYMRVGSLRPTGLNDISPAWVEVDGSPSLMSSKNCIFIKVYVGTNGSMVWALDNCNNIYVREAIYSDFPIGTRWLLVSGIEAIKLAVSDKAVWALSPKGEIFRRYGISTTNFVGDYWKKVPGTAKVLTVSLCDEIWALDTMGQLVKHSQHTIHFKKEVKKYKKAQVVLDPEDKDWEFVESL